MSKRIRFINCIIDLSKKVFCPRVETEYWVKRAIKEILRNKFQEKRIKFLDIFSGSGCIGIAILKNIKNSLCHFIDIDQNAIEQIKINLKLNKISPKRYKIFKSNIFEKIKNSKFKYHFIFANPPYVAKEFLSEVDEMVKTKEPKISWYGSSRGLKYIRKFLKEAKKFMLKDGKIFMEFDPFQKEEIEKILKRENYKKFRFFKDQFKKWRWAKIGF